VFAAQEQEEQLTVLNVMQPAATDAGAADNTAQQLPAVDFVTVLCTLLMLC